MYLSLCTGYILCLPKNLPKGKNSDKENSPSFLHSLISFKHLLSTYSGNVEMKEDSAPGADGLFGVGW